MLLDLDLSVQVEDEKKEGENSMCEAIRQIKAEGRAEGRAEGKQEIIRNMLTKKLSLEEIAELTGVDLEVVAEIASH